MADVSYIVIRIHPDSPVDSGSFGSYLEGLQIQVYPADAPQTAANLLGQIPATAGLTYNDVTLTPIPWGLGYVLSVSKTVTADTAPSGGNFGDTLQLSSINGIPFGASVTTNSNNPPFASNSTVNNISPPSSVTLNNSIPNFVSAGTSVTFYFQYNSLTVDPSFESFSFSLKTSAPASSSKTVDFSNTQGIAVGMQATGSGIPANTTVTAVFSGSVTLSNAVNLAKNDSVQFGLNLNSGIVQHVEQLGFNTFIGNVFVPIPASVATAVVPLNSNPPANSYLDIALVVVRNKLPIPVQGNFYNVFYKTGPQLPTLDQYQAIALEETALYLTLPAPPTNNNPIALTIPTDGTAPAFLELVTAMQTAIKNDPAYFPAGTDITKLTPDQCTRLAYDIVWSLQNQLPLPPDPLEDLYTNPPNSGGSGNSGDEQDRQKFEGAVSSFYSTRNATAVRLAKFVAAASGALYCENKSVNASQGLLEFPVDPAQLPEPAPVESEVLLTGLTPSGVNFGVPAGFFYALGTGLDKSTSGDSRYKIACGDTTERALQQIGQAVLAGSIGQPGTDSEGFYLPLATPPNPQNPITAAQAVRRLSALNVTSSSTSPVVALPASGPLTNVVSAWLAATPTQLPTYQSYQSADADIIWGLIVLNPTPAALAPFAPNFTFTQQPTEEGFLLLVLGALTQGYLIPGTSPAVPLANKIDAFLPQPTIDALKAVTPAQWATFFTANPSFIPTCVQPNTAGTPSQPGYIAACVKLFVRAIQQFFTVSSVAGSLSLPSPESAPLFDPLPFDAISTAVANLPPGFQFGVNPLSDSDLNTAVSGVFSPGSNAEAEAWLKQSLTAINDLFIIASTVPEITPKDQPVAGNLAFSVMEALYARGFRSAKDIAAISPDAFQRAMIGTVAYQFAIAPSSILYTAAQKIAPMSPVATQEPGKFHPINPDGTLTDCVPPPCLSPLGPIEYLHEILNLRPDSTCENIGAGQPVRESATIASAIAGRRGPLGNLVASCANLETPLPLIDIVNECLENAAATAPTTVAGAVHDTADKELDGYTLCKPDDEGKACYPAGELFATMPQWSSPATPVAQPAAYTNLANDFTDCCLPYSQPLDISRSYQRLLCAHRSDTMRTFRKQITEFVLAPDSPPTGFADYLWRYPDQLDIGIEYLGFTPQEFATLFAGTATVPPWQLYGFASELDGRLQWTSVVSKVSEFLDRTCLTYCEFLELQKCGFVSFRNADRNSEDGSFPECEPCCLDNLGINFGEENPTADLTKLAIFIRLWRTLKKHSCGGYSFAQLADVCAVLGPLTGGPLTAEFVRQLAALQMLRDHFGLPLTDPEVKPSGTGVNRTQLLVLWAGPTAANTAIWHWAVSKLIDSIPRLAAVRHHRTPRRGPEIIKLLAGNLDAISRFAGFNPDVTTDSWHARPTCTLRFAEILVKIYASEFSVGDLLYLITAQHHVDGEDVFPLQTTNEALDLPLGLPEDQHSYSLMALRRKLLCAEVNEDAHRHWTWHRISTSLQNEFGYAPDPLAADPDPFLTLGKHLFPGILAAAGVPVSVKDTRYYYGKPVATPALMWNVPPDGPFQCDPGPSPGMVLMWTQAPLRDEAVIDKLSHVHNLDTDEQTAVQDLYFQPRLALARFAFLFPDFAEADRHLIQEPDEKKRWEYFTRHFALTHARCKIIAEHLARHVHHVTREHGHEHAFEAAWLVLRDLFADENAAVPPSAWEDPSGHLPTLTWNQLPGAGAFAALLGLIGTGLMGEFSTAGGQVVWREIRGPLAAFGDARNDHNAPVPTIIPALDFGATTSLGSNTAAASASASGALSTSLFASGAMATPSAISRDVSTFKDNQLRFVSLHNGFASRDRDGSELGGAQGFSARWSGVLLIDNDGRYEFQADAIGEAQRDPAEDHRSWRVVLQRGQRTWLLLNKCWPDDGREPAAALNLKRGAYELSIEFRQSAPDFSRIEDVRRQYTGFRLAYRGPDSDDRWTALPFDRLFLSEKKGTLWDGIKTTVAPSCEAFLKTLYTSSLRDMRRTYQRAFKALLLVERFNLSAKPAADGHSELGYMLANGSLFAGTGFARGSSTSFITNLADFNFNFLPLRDDYLPPAQTDDPRVKPSPQRISALFDWWERLFDYTQVRREAREQRERSLWLLFDEAKSKQPAHPAFLLRHLGIDSRHSNLLLNYYVGPAPGSLYAITAADLQDDRWVVRIWHGEEWIRRMLRCFCPSDITQAQPALWVADDPSVPVPPGTVSGNQNLTELVDDGFLRVEPRRYGEIKELNDGLRERARDALIAYLCRMDRVLLVDGSGGFAQTAGDLSDYFLLDVRTGICERASRIDEAITAVQNFIRRARLGLEPNWPITHEFERMWDRRFATFRIWQACKRRELYQENYIEWEEMERARRIEAFRFLETKLHTAALTIAEAGGGEWWPDQRPRSHSGLMPLQQQEVSWLQQVPAAVPTPEGFTLLGTPESDARPSWLTIASTATQTTTNDTSTAAHTGAAKLAVKAAEATLPGNLPFWLESAIRLGTQFVRVAAAGWPEASGWYEQYPEKDHRGCCAECGCVHPPLVDEYYFWLINAEHFDTTVIGPDSGYQMGIQDPNYDQTQQQSIAWNDPSQVPSLLNWPATPAVRLAWCRVHNGEFRQARKAATLVEVNSSPNLQFVGRGADSLFFAVTGAAPPPTGYKDPSPAGFRYDLPSDDAVALPLPVEATANVPSYPGGLPAYPFFVLDTPGAPLFPESIFAPSIAVAEALRLRCRFDLALKWYELAFAPLKQDCTWITCKAPETTTVTAGTTTAVTVPGTSPAIATGNGTPIGACCDSTAVSREVIHNRAITLHYCETLLDWGVHLMRRWPSPEAFQQSRLLFDTAARILGKHPRTILLEPPATPQRVSSFKPATPPLNPRLLELYDHTADRLRLSHACVDAQRLRNGRLELDMPYFGDNPLRHGWRTSVDGCAEENEWCLRHSPYRFTFLVQKALELAAGVREFGAALLSAYEKGDAEYLASLRAEHERELLILGLAVRQSQWRDADWQIQALQQTKDLNQTNLTYFANLYQNGFINDEIQYQVLANTAMQTRTSANFVEAEGEVMKVIPDLFVGFPCNDTQIPIGTKLAGVFETIGRVMSIFADIQSSTSQLDFNLAGWERRSDDWLHQTQTLPIEIEQIEMQILGAQRRRDQALIELNNHQRQIEQSSEILDFLRDKFTNDQLYLYLQKETASLHRKMYDLALHAARQAEHAFNFERGHTTRRFIPDCGWDTLHEGLLAGERLEYALRYMEKTYCDENVREHELTKHISLRLQFPDAYLRLRTTGYCEIDIPEWMFDLDYPDMYMRRIKNVTVTIPCVTGPYTGVHCRLTLLSSMTRIDPRLRPPPHLCCSDRRRLNDYEACFDDPRVVRQYAAREAIATSSGQNDSGMFELNFRDERYLPFEYLGAVSRWRIELPPRNNYFDLDTLSDLIVNLNYTAREGGELLRRAASEAAERRLPGDGWCFFDVRHEFPDAWQMFRDSARNNGRSRKLPIRFSRRMFPFIPGHREISITALALLFETDDCNGAASHLVTFDRGGEEHRYEHSERAGTDERDARNRKREVTNEGREEMEGIRCAASDDLPRLYYGVIKTQIGPLCRDDHRHHVTFGFGESIGDISRVFLLCRYSISGEPHPTEERDEIARPEHPRRDESRWSPPHDRARDEIPAFSRR